MATKNAQGTSGNYGSVQVDELGNQELSRQGLSHKTLAKHSRYTWSPIKALALPTAFKLSLECHTAADGERWFGPSNAGAFLRNAALAHALREDILYEPASLLDALAAEFDPPPETAP